MRPAEQLEGQRLDNGWLVEKLIQKKPMATGGNFSVGYHARNDDGRRGYLKALDYSSAMQSADPARELQQMTAAYLFERRICEECKVSGLDRVVRPLDFGKTSATGDPMGVVEYIIFELAETDMRQQLTVARAFDVSWGLRTLHHVAVAIQQLHGVGIAHQDIKPSNVLVFGDNESKLGDLGRCSSRSISAPHDGCRIAGDITYAPPELLYREMPTDWEARRVACDLYHLGSLATFLFSRVHMNGLITSFLAPEHRWQQWRGPYLAVLPFVQDAFGRSLQKLSMDLDAWLRDELVSIVKQLCEPNPDRRGHPRNNAGFGRKYGVERFVSAFDLLAKQSEAELRSITIRGSK